MGEVMLRSLMIVGLMSALVGLMAGEAQAAKGKKGKKRHHGVHGVIESVSPEKDKGTLVVKVHPRKKNKGTPPAAGQATEKKVQFGLNTKVEFRTGKKQFAPASLSDLKAGARVRIREKGGQAERIVIRQGKKGKKKNKTAL
jgi:hypothetical protein